MKPPQADCLAVGSQILTDIPARLDRLPWSGWHWRVVTALGVTWILDGLEEELFEPGHAHALAATASGTTPVADPNHAVRLWLWSVYGAIVVMVLIGGITRHEFFPMPLEAVPASFEFHQVEPGVSFAVGPFQIMPIALNHPFGAVGYRIDADGASLAYVADTAPFTEVLHKQHFLHGPEPLSDDDRLALTAMRDALVRRLVDVDTVIYDTHFLPEEYERFPHYGHSTPDHAIDICVEARARRLVLYHHAPSHGDDQMDRIATEYLAKGKARDLEVLTAFEGMTLPIGPEAA